MFAAIKETVAACLMLCSVTHLGSRHHLKPLTYSLLQPIRQSSIINPSVMWRREEEAGSVPADFVGNKNASPCSRAVVLPRRTHLGHKDRIMVVATSQWLHGS